jgi:hypothetical protein
LYFKLKEPLLDYDDVLGKRFGHFDGLSIDSTFEEVNDILRTISETLIEALK